MGFWGRRKVKVMFVGMTNVNSEIAFGISAFVPVARVGRWEMEAHVGKCRGIKEWVKEAIEGSRGRGCDDKVVQFALGSEMKSEVEGDDISPFHLIPPPIYRIAGMSTDGVLLTPPRFVWILISPYSVPTQRELVLTQSEHQLQNGNHSPIHVHRDEDRALC